MFFVQVIVCIVIWGIFCLDIYFVVVKLGNSYGGFVFLVFFVKIRDEEKIEMIYREWGKEREFLRNFVSKKKVFKWLLRIVVNKGDFEGIDVAVLVQYYQRVSELIGDVFVF